VLNPEVDRPSGLDNGELVRGRNRRAPAKAGGALVAAGRRAGAVGGVWDILEADINTDVSPHMVAIASHTGNSAGAFLTVEVRVILNPSG